MHDPQQDIVELARREADALIAEAKAQAETLLKAAERRRAQADAETSEAKAAGQELARNIERTIDLLSQILQELRRQIG